MTPTLLLLALLACLTYRSPVQQEYSRDFLVRMVWEASGVDGVAVVWCESEFNPQAVRREPRGHSSFGLWQLDDEWHAQHRDDLAAHVRTGAAFLEECKHAGSEARNAGHLSQSPFTRGPAPFSSVVARYNGGGDPGAYSIAWGKRVERVRDSLVLWAWRHLR